MAPRNRPHRPLSIGSSHWRADGQPKTRFDARHEAQAAAAQRAEATGAELNVYRCAFCGGWHMGGADARRSSDDEGPTPPRRR